MSKQYNLIIRKATEKDFEELLKMNIGLIDAMKSYYPKKERKDWNKKFLAFVENRMKTRFKNKNDLMFIAEKSKQIIGYIYGALKKEKSDPTEMERHCYIEEVFVKKGFRGGIIGESLLEKLINEARRMGIKKFNADVFVKNRDARKLFKKFKFYEHSLLYVKNF